MPVRRSACHHLIANSFRHRGSATLRPWYRSHMRMVIGVLALVAMSPLAAAQPPGLTDTLPAPVDHGRDTSRVTFGAGIGDFASYPMSIDDPGLALFVSKPLWLGNRYRFFQWVAEANALVGLGYTTMHGYAAVGPQFGWNFYFGSVFGLEFRVGVDGLLQAGSRTVAGIGMGGSGAYVFRFWDDDRTRVKLMMQMHAGGYFADDPGNDLGTNAGVFALGLAYEKPM